VGRGTPARVLLSRKISGLRHLARALRVLGRKPANLQERSKIFARRTSLAGQPADGDVLLENADGHSTP